MTALETRRLVLRPFAETDLDQFAAIMSDPEVTRYLGDGEPLDRASTWRAMALTLGHERLRGYTQAAVVDKASGRLLGRGGLWYPEGWPGLEVGWILGRFAWGQGYATELGAACRNLAFEILGAAELVSVIHPDNTRSVAVAERIGHRFLRDVTVSGRRCLLYGQQRPALSEPR
jgi:RimJ/RimL family protein N-acetyltransferase